MKTDYFEFFTPEGKGIIATLEEGVVTFAIEAGPTSSVRGTEMFNRMMEHFGDAVRAIQGVWVKGNPKSPSMNIDKVNELTASGMPLDQAVSHTWTATRARKRGFNEVTPLIVDDPDTNRCLPRGEPGFYTRVEVLIQRGK